MANDANKTIQDSRRAAMSFLETANEKERRRNNKVAPGDARSGSAGSNAWRAANRARADFFRGATGKGAAKDAAKDAAAENGAEKIGSYAGARAVENFLRAGRRREARAEAAKNGGETPFDLAQRIRLMSDSEFEEALKSGAITPEQLRKAGEDEWDTYMGDVWSENPDNDDVPEPTYDEFIADPQRYGVTYTDEDAAGDPDASIYPVRWGRYRSTVKQQ